MRKIESFLGIHTFRQKVICLILFFSACKLLTATFLELGNDESYYWLYSQHLQWNYFDHPPIVAAWIRIFTLNLWLDDHEVFVRLGSIVSCAFSTWFIFRAVSLIKDERAGWYAAFLFNTSFYSGIVAGLLVMPDSPQLFFWTFCLWRIVYLATDEKNWKEWIMIGAAIGFCTMSKVHGLFLWVGLLLYIAGWKRKWLSLPQLYVSLLITALLVSPLLLWNITHGFITWRFHGARVNIGKADPAGDSFFAETVAQWLINNPVNCLVILFSLLALRLRSRKTHPSIVVYNCIAIPMALLFMIISFFRDIWPHWSAPAYTTLIPLAAIIISGIKKPRLRPFVFRLSAGIFFLFLFGWPAVIRFYPGTFGNTESQSLGQGDVTLDKYGWETAGEQFYKLYQRDSLNGIMPAGAPVVCPTWWGAHQEYYFCNPYDIPVIGLGDTLRIHQYAWLNKKRMPQVNMDASYCIVSTIENENIYQQYDPFYNSIASADTICLFRNGKPAMNFFVYRLRGWKNPPSLAVKAASQKQEQRWEYSGYRQ